MARGLAVPLLAAALLAASLPAAGPAGAQVSRNVTLLAHVDSYNEYAAGCAYVHADGREYACIGSDTGTAIYNIEVPTAPALVAFIPGPPSIWREMKPYGDHLYIVSEGAGAGAGLQIVRMTNPQAPVLAATYTTTFTTAHTVTIDADRQLLYANGANGASGGMRILSLADPEAPVEVGAYYGHYVHDSHVDGTRLFLACIYSGLEVVLDVTDPAAPVELAQWSTPGQFTHNSWLSEDGQYLFTTDENSGAQNGFLAVYDVSNLAAPVEVGRFSANPGAIVHNVRVKGDTAFVSYYTEGVRLLDISDPTTPVEFGYYDTWAGASGGFHGNWDVDPFFPSGVFMVTDIESGLWIFRAEPDYNLVSGVVSESPGGAPLGGVQVTVTGTGAEFLTYPAGKYAFALDPGVYDLDFDKFGYFPSTQNVTLPAGPAVTRNVGLLKIPSGSLAGTISGGAGFTPLASAALHLHETPLETASGVAGDYDFPDVPEGNWLLEAERPGYVPGSRVVQVVGSQAADADLNLQAWDFYHDVETAAGWALSATGDNATSGRWVRAGPVGSGPQSPGIVPLGAGAPGTGAPGTRAPGDGDRLPRDGRLGLMSHHPQYEAGPQSGQPEDDNTPAPGVTCFITGNGVPGGSVGAADVDNGRTTLVSPTFDLSGLPDPHVAFYYWYVNDVGSNPGEDPFVISISNNGGSTWVEVASIFSANHLWEPYDFRVADFVAPTASVKVRFVAQDLGGGSVVEAGVDDFGYYQPAVQSGTPGRDLSARPPLAGALLAGPNPFLMAADLSLALAAETELAVTVFDASGRLVRRLHDGPAAGEWQVRWDGRDESGRMVGPGVYFVRAAGPGFDRLARLVRLR